METEANSGVFSKRAYAIKEHFATRHHYDLRLEFNGVLLSWALPDGPSCRTAVIRKAIEMEDHNRVNLLFEGLHDTGLIARWDQGTWEPHPEFDDIAKSLRGGMLRFTLYGEKLKGAWTLTRIDSARNARRPVWTLCKDADEFADSPADRCVLERLPNSVTGKTMEEIARPWTSPRDKHERQSRLFDAMG
jgi:bifunctional non-homologous end joining protein LigD